MRVRSCAGTATGTRLRCGWDRWSWTRQGTKPRTAAERLALTPKEFALLRYLMSRPGEALSEFELLTHVWTNANPLTRTVRVTVMTLRRKLAGNPIETVTGAGCRRDDA